MCTCTKLAQCLVMLKMQLCTSHNLVLIIVLLLVTGVRTRRVIRAAPGTETTGEYMVVLTPETSHERFEVIAEKIQIVSPSSKIHKMEGPFAKMVVTRLSVDEANKVSFKCLYVCVCVCVSLSVSMHLCVWIGMWVCVYAEVVIRSICVQYMHEPDN